VSKVKSSAGATRNIQAAALALAAMLAGTAVIDPTQAQAPAASAVSDGSATRTYTTWPNETGRLGVLIRGAAVDQGNPFFKPLGETGRSCASCHSPESAMGLSTDTIRDRWKKSGATDPIFAAVSGANCPNLPQDKASSHSLLLERGVFRLAYAWPPRKIERPEFSIEVVRDPTGCNTSSEYGLAGIGQVSVFRRPRIVANLKYIVKSAYDRRYQTNVKTGYAIPRDPETGMGVTLGLSSDARNLTLREQVQDSIAAHMPGAKFSPDEMQRLLGYMQQVYAAQAFDATAGDLTEQGGPPGLGPFALAEARPGLFGEALNTPVFQSFEAWQQAGTTPTSVQAAFRASVARGAELFLTRTFLIDDVSNINTTGLGNPVKRGCVLCHNAQMTGNDVAPGWMDLGLTNWPKAADEKDLPLFKLTCRNDAPPHPYLGRVIYTSDPGRALVTGQCADIGSLNVMQMRGLAARAPYFNNGAAKTLREVVDFYDRRFRIGLTEQERQDLVNFMRVL